MFNSILISDKSEPNAGSVLDIGMLLESMLFYTSTRLVLNGTRLENLFQALGVEQLIALVDEQHLKLVFSESMTGICTTTSKLGVQVHTPVLVSSPQHTFEEEVRKLTNALPEPQSKRKGIAKWLESNVTVTRHDAILCEGARKSLLDQSYLKRSVPAMIESLVPDDSGLEGIEFFAESLENGGFLIHTNLDFRAINAAHHQHAPESRTEKIGPAWLLTRLFSIESDLYFSSRYFCELASDPLRARLMAERMEYLAHLSSKSRSQITRFQDFVFDDAKNIREAINCQRIDVSKVVAVIRNSTRFKEWLVNKEGDQDLIKEYYKAVTTDTFIDKLPGKTARWAIFTCLGLAADVVATGGLGFVAGTALGALDTFYIDKLIKGWKPNQFIETDFKRLGQ
jgi:hypothetical protein